MSLIPYYGAVNQDMADTTPDAFHFTKQTNIALNTTVTSNTITISGIDSPSPISIATVTGNHALVGYSIDSGTYTTSSGTITNGQTVSIRLTTHALFNGDIAIVALTIGGVTGNFQVECATPAPGFASPQIESMSYMFWQASGFGPWTTQAISYNTTTTNNTIASNGVAAGGAAATNYLVANGTTNNQQIPANDPMLFRVRGTLTNMVYDPSVYPTFITVHINVEHALDAATGNDNALANTELFSAGAGSTIGVTYELNEELWGLQGVTSNSMSNFDFYISGMDQDNITGYNGSGGGAGRNYLNFGVIHQGHPAPTVSAAAGTGSPNLCVIRFQLSVKVMDPEGAVLHNIGFLQDADLHMLPG